MKYGIRMSAVFRRDLKSAKKRNMDISKLSFVTKELADGKTLDEKFKDHALHGEWEGCRECHIEPDWLLIYKTDNNEVLLYLLRNGTHSDLF